MKKHIGIVGGMGSYAGLDLLRKVYDASGASRDQDHFPVTLISSPQETADRTLFLTGQSTENPSAGMLRIIERLATLDVKFVGIPCNTAHAKPILDDVISKLPAGLTLVHLIDSVAHYISEHYPEVTKVGILGTTGTISTGVYKEALQQWGIEALHPENTVQQDFVMNAIYHDDYGIKACSNPVADLAKQQLLDAADHLIAQGAEVIVLGCTEIPLAITQSEHRGYPLLDATQVLAKKLVQLASA
jgi:aspartate racemase